MKKGAPPMLNGILTALLVFSVVTAAFTGPRRRGALTLAWIAGCAKLVFPGDLSLGAVFAAGIQH